jgi:folate-dependent tRNA-U54 methylase TrmFO/GidA
MGVHSSSPLSRVLQQQLKLQGKQLETFLNCPLTKEEYLEILKAGGYIKE